jgi:hypothetical protein
VRAPLLASGTQLVTTTAGLVVQPPTIDTHGFKYLEAIARADVINGALTVFRVALTRADIRGNPLASTEYNGPSPLTMTVGCVSRCLLGAGFPNNASLASGQVGETTYCTHPPPFAGVTLIATVGTNVTVYWELWGYGE